MSAFIVDEKTVKGLAVFYVMNGHSDRTDRKEMTKIANELYAENVKSVNYRYNETEKPVTILVSTQDMLKEMELMQVLKSADCLEYQSCEHDEYYSSKAYELLNAIRKRAIHKLPGYDEAQWD